MFENLLDYSDTEIDEVEVDGELYRTDPNFEPSAIVGQAFGSDYSPDSYNYQLAENISAARDYFGDDLPIFAQSEIAYCLDEIEEEDVQSIGEVYEEDESSTVISKMTTSEILGNSYENMVEEDLDTGSILYLSHPAHTERVMDIGKTVGLDGQPFLSKEVEWPSEDPQPWVKSPYLWAPREIGARLHHKITSII